MRFFFLAVASVALSACSTMVSRPAPRSITEGVARPPVTLLVAIDGFRPDYLDRGVTPNLSRLAAEGVSASMRPSFPTKTFPNFWSIVTGLVPDRHGITANSMEDPARTGEIFSMATDDPYWWSAAEPVWVTAEKAGIRTATMFWPGSNVAWGGVRTTVGSNAVDGGVRPADWQQFNRAVTDEQRVNAVIDWLRRPSKIRPRFVTLYFNRVDVAGHLAGPDAPETTAAVEAIDAAIGRLINELAGLKQPVNFVIVSDHGMAETSSRRTIALDLVANAADYRLIESGPYAGIVASPGRETALEAALIRPHAHMECWPRAKIPPRFRYGANPRVPPYLCLAETGWRIAKSLPTAAFTGGDHGYDNAAPEMQAIFIGNGPAFARGPKLPAFDNTDVAPLLRGLLGLPADQSLDGSDEPFEQVVLRESGSTSN